ncbi:hypothetical protein DL89DRAFT_268528 [Linderina pennispora]|uniref:S-adenosyl-L-methionine dependent methyltransferase n=1 Tax=Linderina pennispora TaxID=61395 RepID=A0A1Y1W6G2_9FUNG|nr:uncharacterized protein DL89DRAFT_268528 [Linderina pennispora]ORX68754.1 hypothetical protein DL89DRAFT_268528 [Linderina pennispora]
MKRETSHDTDGERPKKRAHVKDTSDTMLPPHVDYQILSTQYPDLKQYLRANTNTGRLNVLDFGSPDAVRTLNKAMLKVHFDLDIQLPENSLCPSVPNRYGYVKWLADTFTDEFGDTEVVGLDIGTGASCIYPLLGARAIKNSKFIGSDINQESIEVANDNIKRNCLLSRIQTYLNTTRTRKIPLDAAGFPYKTLSFCMCNPPFYADEKERARLENMKGEAPILSTSGKDDEFYTDGGELAFVIGLVDESLVFRNRVRWYTTMVGRKSTLVELRKRLRSEKDVIRIKEHKITLGKTTRQFIAWSFDRSPLRQLTIPRNLQSAMQWTLDTAKDLGISVQLVGDLRVELSATRVTWSRKARRQAKLQASSSEDVPRDPILEATATMNEVDGSWTRIDLLASTSYDLACFETLYTHLLRRISELSQ